jgi:LysM repeat protein
VDELKRYVDREWPAVAQVSKPAVSPISKSAEVASPQSSQVGEPAAPHQSSAAQAEFEDEPEARFSDAVLRRDIRYLLARRLTRLNRGFEAREYFPPEWQPAYDALMQSLSQGWDETQAASQRAAALYAAAFITRTNGLELLGTEVGPDWAVHGGGFEEGVTAEVRTNENFNILRASADELRRAHAHTADPETRFHYRYQAAFLAWEAAKLMPNNSDETARVLCTAGSWLKNRDPETADIFYKALVRRCRKTAIGDQADRRRWFPVLDENGNPTPWEPKAKRSEPEPAEAEAANMETMLLPVEPPASLGDEAMPQENDSEAVGQLSELGYEYAVQSGDTLHAIVQAYKELGIPVTLRDLRRANPELESAPLHVGQRLFVPAGKPAKPSTEPEE